MKVTGDEQKKPHEKRIEAQYIWSCLYVYILYIYFEELTLITKWDMMKYLR